MEKKERTLQISKEIQEKPIANTKTIDEKIEKSKTNTNFQQKQTDKGKKRHRRQIEKRISRKKK